MWEVIFTGMPQIKSQIQFPFLYSVDCLGAKLSQSFCCWLLTLNESAFTLGWSSLALLQWIYHSSTLFSSKRSANQFSLLVFSRFPLPVPPSLSAHEERNIFIRIWYNQYINNGMWKQSKFYMIVGWRYYSFTENTINPADDHEDEDCLAPLLQLILHIIADYTICFLHFVCLNWK